MHGSVMRIQATAVSIPVPDDVKESVAQIIGAGILQHAGPAIMVNKT
jgi:hypothetical protein